MPTDRSGVFPPHPMLRPGVRVCRREDGLLQVGLASHLAVRAPDTDEIRGILSSLRDGAPLPSLNAVAHVTARFCADLLEHGLLVDADDLLRALGSASGDRERENLAAHVAEHGTAMHWHRRTELAVEVRSHGLPAAADLTTRLLSTANLPSGTTSRPDLTVLLTSGVIDREEVDDLVRAEHPHLLLSCAEGQVLLGPFVVPGASACLRCIDAHHTDRDPRRSLVIEQYLRPWATTVADPVPHDLLTVAIGALVRDVTTWADGGRPTTWSAVLEIDPALTFPRTPWPRHPGCGCNWDELYAG